MNKQFDHWVSQLDKGKFWAWLGHSDNASHFKSGPVMRQRCSMMSIVVGVAGRDSFAGVVPVFMR